MKGFPIKKLNDFILVSLLERIFYLRSYSPNFPIVILSSSRSGIQFQNWIFVYLCVILLNANFIDSYPLTNWLRVLVNTSHFFPSELVTDLVTPHYSEGLVILIFEWKRTDYFFNGRLVFTWWKRTFVFLQNLFFFPQIWHLFDPFDIWCIFY